MKLLTAIKIYSINHIDFIKVILFYAEEQRKRSFWK